MKLNVQPAVHRAIKNRKIFEDLHRVTVEVDNADEDKWESYLDLFEDASLYQTWSYGKNFPGGRNISHMVLKRSGAVLALAQARILTLPFLQRGIAYVFWGPVWQRKGFTPDKRILSAILKAMHHEYVKKRKLLLRIVPGLPGADENEFGKIFKPPFYEKNETYRPQMTTVVNLEASLPEIRNRFHHKWRNRLNVAERNELEVLEGTGEDLFLMFRNLYMELLLMKEIPVEADIDNFIKIQSELPEKHKMRIFICTSQGRAIAGLVGSLLGVTGICLLAAANREGRELLGTYLLQWKLINWLKENRARRYDLGGIDPEKNPGGYRFKSGLGGKDLQFLGQYESCRSLSSRIIVNTGEYLKKRRMKS